MTQEITFTRGDFRPFRALTKIHLGSVDRYIDDGEIVEFDGQTVIIGDERHSVATLRSAIRMQWLVPETDTTSQYRPQAANISIRPAKAADQASRGQPMKVETVQDEERNLGNLEQVRNASRARVIREGDGTEASSEGQVIARTRTPANQKTVITDASAADREIHRLDNKPPPRPVTMKTSGDVDQAIAGDDLDDILPDAATTRRPQAGTAGEGNLPHLTKEERERVQAKETSKVSPKASEEDPKFFDVFRVRLDALKAVIPDFDWSVTRPAKDRVRDAISRYAEKPQHLNAVLVLETEQVKKAIRAHINTSV